MSKLSKISTADLVKELEVRGYEPSSFWNVNDIQILVDEVNSEYNTSITISNESAKTLLKSVFSNFNHEDLKNYIKDLIQND